MPLACGPYDQLATTIHDKFQESPHTVGTNVDGSVLVVFSTLDGATYTLVRRHGTTGCVITVGKGLFSEGVGQPS